MTGPPQSSVKRYRELARNPPGTGLERDLLLDGAHLLAEARASHLQIESAAFDHEVLSSPEIRALAEKLAADGTDVFIVSRKSLEAMSPVKTPSGVVAIVRRSLVSLKDAINGSGSAEPLVVIAHDVQDPGNVGAIVRTAEATSATAVIVTPGSADPFGWKALRGSMGSSLRMRVARADLKEVLQQCRHDRVQTIALTPRGGQPFFAVDFQGPSALVLGSEGAGLPDSARRQADHQVSIPMGGPVESLNVGVAAALVLYEAFRQRTAQ